MVSDETKGIGPVEASLAGVVARRENALTVGWKSFMVLARWRSWRGGGLGASAQFRENDLSESESMAVGIVVERRELDNPWLDHSWHVVAVIPGAPEIDDWVEIRRSEGRVQFHARTLPITLFRGETEGYKYNLSLDPPRVYVILREADEADAHEVEPFLATVCPYEAQDYLDSGDETVETSTMPGPVTAWLAAFVERHHVDRPFIKRERKPYDPRKHGSDGPPRAGIRGGGRHG